MNIKKMILACFGVFLAFEVMDYTIHGLILAPVYVQLAHIWRQDMMSKMWLMALSTLVMSVMFVYIFIKGYENKGIAEGIRFGIVTGLFMNFMGMFGQYVMYPVPFDLTVKWFIFGMLEFMIAGMVAAIIYKPAK
jgi:hypothetical protein